MLIYYVLIGIVVGAVLNIQRPAKYDDASTGLKIAVPVIAGLIWPLLVIGFIYYFIREIVT